jgi:hypothetical protein
VTNQILSINNGLKTDILIKSNLHLVIYIIIVNVHWYLRLHLDVHPADGVLHGRAAEATHPEVELMTDATLGAAVVDDLFGIRPVAPTSRLPNADVGILDRQQRNVVVVAVIKLVPPHNVVEILLDEVVQPPLVGVLPPAVRGRRAAADFLEQCLGFGVCRVATVHQHG